MCLQHHDPNDIIRCRKVVVGIAAALTDRRCPLTTDKTAVEGDGTTSESTGATVMAGTSAAAVASVVPVSALLLTVLLLLLSMRQTG